MEAGGLVKAEASLIDLQEDLTDQPGDQALYEEMEAKGDQMLDQEVVGYLSQDLAHDYYGPSPLSDFAGQVFEEVAGVEASVLLGGLFMTDLKAGPVSKKDLHDCLPHPLRLARVTMRGGTS